MTKLHLAIFLTTVVLLTSIFSCCPRKKTTRHANDHDTLTADIDTLQESDTIPTTDSVDVHPFILKHLHVDQSHIMPYVTCKSSYIKRLLAIADTVYSNTDNYKLEDIDMTNKEYNSILARSYGDSLHILVALYMSYNKFKATGYDNPNAVFAWHEVAKCQMNRFMKARCYHGGRRKGYKNILLIADSLQRLYGGGCQSELTRVARSEAMPAEFNLIDSYKQLIDLCKDPEVKKLVHRDYKYTVDTHRKYCKKTAEEGWWSCQEMDFAGFYSCVMEKKKKNIDYLLNTCRNDSVNLPLVKKNLKEHRCIIGKHKYKSVRLTPSLFDMDDIWNY